MQGVQNFPDFIQILSIYNFFLFLMLEKGKHKK
jgi:hypothetical protein